MLWQDIKICFSQDILNIFMVALEHAIFIIDYLETAKIVEETHYLAVPVSLHLQNFQKTIDGGKKKEDFLEFVCVLKCHAVWNTCRFLTTDWDLPITLSSNWKNSFLRSRLVFFCIWWKTSYSPVCISILKTRSWVFVYCICVQSDLGGPPLQRAGKSCSIWNWGGG